MSKSATLLYIEDDDLDRRAFLRMVREKGLQWTVSVAETVAEARALLARQHFDVVVADYHLPDGDSTELFDETSDVPFILITGTLEEQVALRTLERGADDYLPKDPDLRHLQAVPFAVEKTLYRKTIHEKAQRLAQECEDARLAAEESSRAKDRFMAVLSHELRTPLTPVLAAVSLLQKEPALAPHVQKNLEVIRRNVELEARLIDDLLDLTSISQGKIKLDKRTIQLCEIINRAIEVCKPDIDARRLHFGVEFRSRDDWVQADAARLQQVFWNLIKNSIKFTPPGGCLGAVCYAQNGEVVAEINDSGIGIEPDALPRIFNAFAQAEQSIARQFGGLGLGLAISKSLVELHGGRIEAHSKGRGTGATFTVCLPQVSPPVVQPTEQVSNPGTTDKMHVLVVEDHGDTAELLRFILESEGHTVELAGDVQTAVRKLDLGGFNLLLSDLGLPDGNGIDLVRHLQATGRNIPAIALSGYGQESDVQQTRGAGFAAHVTKPVDIDRLLASISSVVKA